MLRSERGERLEVRSVAAYALFLLLLLVLLSPLAAVAQESAPRPQSYLLSTASTGGTYYPVGVAIANLIKVRLQAEHGISVSAISSAGSAENVKLLRDREVEFAILQGIFAVWAWQGDGPAASVGPQTHLRSVTMLWRNVEHFILRTDLVRDGTLSDLRGLDEAIIAVGNRNSGSEASNNLLFERLGIQPGFDIERAYLGYNQGADGLRNGTVDGMSAPAGIPVGGVTQAFASLGGDITLLEFTDEDMEKLNTGLDLWARFEIEANTYPGQTAPVRSLAMPNVLAVHESVDEETVYLITRTIWENLPYLRNIHRATREMALDGAIDHMPLPLHPGALRYYLEVGLDIPEALYPPQVQAE